MARRRMIDPNIWQSEDVSKLTIRQRLLLIGLFSNADDEGKLRGHPAFVRSTVFPYEDIAIADMQDDLNAIEEIGTITQYEVDGDKYIILNNWLKFQRVDKPQPSMIPDPISPTNNDDIEPPGEEGKNHSKNGSENGSKNSSRLKEKKRKEDKYTHEFELFWKEYPRKVSKKRAFANWKKRIRDDTAENLILAAKHYAISCQQMGTEIRYIKHPSTFLSDKEDYKDYLEPPEQHSEPVDLEERRLQKERENFNRKIALQRWIEAGNDPNDFVYRGLGS